LSIFNHPNSPYPFKEKVGMGMSMNQILNKMLAINID